MKRGIWIWTNLDGGTGPRPEIRHLNWIVVFSRKWDGLLAGLF